MHALELRLVLAVACLAGGFFAIGPTELEAGVADQPQVTLSLISARDHIDGGMPARQSVYADQSRIYLATSTGKLFVLARDQAANFPLLQVVADTTTRLTAVRGDGQYLYVISADGMLRVYQKGSPLVLVKTLPLVLDGGLPSPLGGTLTSLAVTDDYVYVASAAMVVDQNHLYLQPLNPGESAVRLAKPDLVPDLRYEDEAGFVSGMTQVFDLASGEPVGAILDPGNPQPLFADGGIVGLSTGGCCGRGVFLHDPNSLVGTQTLDLPVVNAIERRGTSLVVGDEFGAVQVFDLQQNPSPLVASLNLRTVTGHTGSEDIEIRSLWTDDYDNLIFAGSSWGNDQSRSLDLPPFFVLALATSNTLRFGDQSVETNTDSNPPGLAEAFRLIVPADGTLANLSLYVGNGTTATAVKVGMYADTNGHPGALLGQGTLSSPQAGSWNDVSLPPLHLSSGQLVWLAVVGVDGDLVFNDRCCGGTGTGPSETSRETTLTDLPAFWSPGTTYTDGPLSAAATLNVTSAPLPLLGQDQVQPQLDVNPDGLAEAFRMSATSDGTLSRLNVYLDPNSQAAKVIVGLYDDNGGHPDTLLAEGSIDTPAAGAWNSVPLGSSIPLAAGSPYWIAILSPAGAGTVRFEDGCCGAGGSSPSETSAQTTLTDLPTIWTAGQTYPTDGPLSAYSTG